MTTADLPKGEDIMRWSRAVIVGGLLVVAATAGCSKDKVTAGPVQPWEAVDEAFKGCEGG
jgi:hypothetical protein